MKPGGLIGSEDQTLRDWIDFLESLGGASNNYSFDEHFSWGIMPEGEVGVGIVGDVEVWWFFKEAAGVVLSREYWALVLLYY